MSTTLRVVNGDIWISPNTGQPEVISGMAKCSQDLAESLMTQYPQPAGNRSAEAFSRAYGSELASIDTPPFYVGITGKPLISKKIQESIQRLQIMQQSDPSVTSDEKIESINQIAVEQFNLTDYFYFVRVLVQSGSFVDANNLTPVQLDHQFPFSSDVSSAEKEQVR
jgi:hypothetical protein